MDYQIALAPELGLSPRDLVEAWNESPERRAVAGGIVSNFLYDLIKERLAEEGVRRRTEILEVEQPDGSRLLVVTITEEPAP